MYPQLFLHKISGILKKQQIIIDLISSNQQMLSIALCTTEQFKFDQAIGYLLDIGFVSIIEHMSIVSVIGHNMGNMVGVGAEVFSALASAKVNIYLISQGTSENSIAYVLLVLSIIRSFIC